MNMFMHHNCIASPGDVRKMEVNVATVHSRSVILNWMGFNIDDQRKLLGYVVYSIEAPYQNVTMYDGRDACGGDGYALHIQCVPVKASHPV